MSVKELDRVQLLGLVIERRLSLRAAAKRMHLSERQARRLLRRFEANGAAGLVSGQRGRPSNRRLPETIRERAIALVREKYHDFGPTLAHEKLTKLHGIGVSVETLRKWLIEENIWATRTQRRRQIHQPRARRECYGELIQIDGSEHRWFEDRGPACTLLVFIDDATGKLMGLRFCDAESTFNYFEATKTYLRRHGKPVAFYSDKASVFRVNAKQPKGGDGYTQFGRAMGDLNIDTLCANTPQAKGRVERVNSTLQNRLVKELRLRGISTIEAANAFALEFMRDFNERFGRPALNPRDAHRPLRPEEDLGDVFTWQETRKLTNNLTLHYKRVMYVLDKTDQEARRAMGKRVDILETEDGKVRIRFEGRDLPARPFDKQGHVRQGAIVENKLLSAALKHAQEQQKKRDRELL
ncbi:MAG: ISNCY family transposase, partial [Myxococcales bacterium]|nr:ISNCY family transposase [Myxococcales bacterium]